MQLIERIGCKRLVRSATLASMVGKLALVGSIGLSLVGLGLVLAGVPSAPLVVSLGVGGLLVGRGDVGRRMRATVLALLDAARPLALLFLVVGFFFAIHNGPVVQVLYVAVLLAIVVPWLATDEWPALVELLDTPKELLRSKRSWLGSFALLLVAALIVAAVLPGRLLPQLPDDRGGLPTSIALIALGAWMLALVLRFVGFGTILPRLPLALALLAAVACGLAAAKLLPFADDPPAWLWTVVALLIVVFLALAVWRVPANKEYTGSGPDLLASLGLLFALLSMVLMTTAVGLAKHEASQTGDELDGEAVGAGAPAERPADMTERQLQLSFMPVLRFRGDADWRPQKVDLYLKGEYGARLRGPKDTTPVTEATEPVGSIDKLPQDCPRGFSDPCYTLTTLCETADDPCAGSHAPDDELERGGAVYVRVVERTRTPGHDPPPLPAVGQYKNEVAILVQYWFFYRYDEWVAPVLAGRIVQRHQGDWEAVTVGLSADEPLFVAFSEHCGGRWEKWDKRLDAVSTDMAGVDGFDDGQQRTHPLVAVAKGSQANYARAHAGHIPDWSSCLGVPGESVALLSYAWNIRDRTGDDSRWIPIPENVLPAREDELPMSFPGTWGDKDTTQYVTTKPHDIGDPKRGPRSPPGQPLWNRTIRQIFCGVAWRGPVKTKDCDVSGSPD
jgi:hypothetical protein